jgi:hypothetical protein
MDKQIKAKIRYLCGYITDKSAIMLYLNREFGCNLKIADIEYVINNGPRQVRCDFVPMTPSPAIATHTKKGYDPLAMALFQYHANRTTGKEHDFWLSRMVEKRKKPNVSIQL